MIFISRRLISRETVGLHSALFTVASVKRCRDYTRLIGRTVTTSGTLKSYSMRFYTENFASMPLSSLHKKPLSPKEERRLAGLKLQSLLKVLGKVKGTDAKESRTPLSPVETIVLLQQRAAGLGYVVRLLKSQLLKPQNSTHCDNDVKPVCILTDSLDDSSNKLSALISSEGDFKTCFTEASIFLSIITNDMVGIILHTCVELLSDLQDLLTSPLPPSFTEVTNVIKGTVSLSEDLVQCISLSMHTEQHKNDQKSDKQPILKWDENTLSTAIRIQCIVMELVLDSTSNDVERSITQLSLVMSKYYEFLRQKRWVRHRTISPLISACYKVQRCCIEQKNHVNVAIVLTHLHTLCIDSNTHSVDLDELDYQHILQCYSGASCLAVSLGSKGTAISFPLGTLHQILSQMAICAPLLTVDAAEAVELWIKCLKDLSTPLILDGQLPISGVWSKSDDCHKEVSDIIVKGNCCALCGTKLVGQPFPSSRKDFILKEIQRIAQQKPCKKNNAVKNIGNRFEAFVRLISTSPPFSSIIDGANVGYYGLSSWYPHRKAALLVEKGELSLEKSNMYLNEIYKQKAETDGGSITSSVMSNKNPLRFDRDRSYVDVPPSFSLIDDAATKMESEYGLKSLIFLHSRHVEAAMNDTVSQHNNNRGKYNTHCSEFTSHDAALVRKWRAQERLFVTPNGVDDDLCWLYASIYGTVPTDDISAGKDRVVYVLTNDKMRDHSFALLSQDVISRWRGRHQVRFDCTFDKEMGTSLLQLKFPPLYENVVQFNAKKEIWHIPYQGFKTRSKAATEIGASLENGDNDTLRWMCLRADNQRPV